MSKPVGTAAPRRAYLQARDPAIPVTKVMPPAKKDTVTVACPKCGHTQPEPRGAYSTICKKCHAHFRLAESQNPTVKPVQQVLEQRKVACFQCGTELEVPLAATSTMCKRCS